MINLKLAFYAFLVRLAEQSPSFIEIVDCNKGKRLGLILSRHGLVDFKNARSGKNSTEWKIKDFSVIQILREITFGES